MKQWLRCEQKLGNEMAVIGVREDDETIKKLLLIIKCSTFIFVYKATN
tara:strand:- start:146135 stop:146278 length:144 start_codon:yes stop_codon:yes gene_type:complete